MRFNELPNPMAFSSEEPRSLRCPSGVLSAKRPDGPVPFQASFGANLSRYIPMECLLNNLLLPPPRSLGALKRAFSRIRQAGLLALCALLLSAGEAQAQPTVKLELESTTNRGEFFGRKWEGVVFNFKITATPAPAADLTVNLRISQSGGNFVAPSDLGNKTVTVTTSGSATYSVATVDDNVREGDGNVSVRLPCTPAPCTDYMVGTPNSHSQTVLDDELPEVTVSGFGQIPEGGIAAFDVTASTGRRGATPLAAPVTVTLTPRLLRSRVDPMVLPNGVPIQLTVPTSGTATWSVPTVDNDVDEDYGYVNLLVRGVGGATGYRAHPLMTNSSAWIFDNDDPSTGTPVVSVTGGPAVTEGTSAEFTVTANPAPAADLAVSVYFYQQGRFVASTDLGTKTVTVPTSGSAKVTVPTVDDTVDEGGGSVSALTLAGTGYAAHNRIIGTGVRVMDNDDPSTGTPVVSVTRGPAVTEGTSATFTVTVDPVPATDVLVQLWVHPRGRYLAPGQWGQKVVTVGTSGSATYSVPTVDDDIEEWDSNVTVRAQPRDSDIFDLYALDNSHWQATVPIRDNDGSFRQPGDTEEGSTRPPEDPQPLQLALWTDSTGYRAGETIRLYHTLDPHDDRGHYRTIVYLERVGGDERRYLAPLDAGDLHDEAVDASGLPAEASVPRILHAADKKLIYEGLVPEPGLWQFVLELWPGPSVVQGKTLRAWARFVVAERSQLLNRRGFDREVRTDLTLRSDTIYYLGHQLFVHDGATLTIEPGTLVRASGPNTAIIVEPGGRIVAEGTREAPVVLTCSSPVGRRQPGCWAGLRILGKGPVTRLEGVAPGVLPAQRPVYGGADEEDSSGSLSYVRVEFAGASSDPESTLPAIGLYGVGSGTVLDHLQARESLGDGFAFHGGTAACDHCVASGSGHAGLSWDRGWRGSASHLYVQHGAGGVHGIAGASDEQDFDREPRSHPTLSNVTLVHSRPYGRRERKGIAVRLRHGSGLTARDLLATRFLRGAIQATDRAYLRFAEGENSVASALLWSNGSPQVPRGIAEAVQFAIRDPKLRDVRDFPNPDPRPKTPLPVVTLRDDWTCCIGAFGTMENWLESWTVFGPESAYDLR